MDPPKRERSDLLTSIQSRDRSSACPGRSPVEVAFYNTLARGGAKIIECRGIVSFLETASSTAERVGYCPQKIAENSVIFAVSETICTVVYSTEHHLPHCLCRHLGCFPHSDRQLGFGNLSALVHGLGSPDLVSCLHYQDLLPPGEHFPSLGLQQLPRQLRFPDQGCF